MRLASEQEEAKSALRGHGDAGEHVRCEALTLIGKDADAGLILSELAAAGVGTRYVKQTGEAATQVASLAAFV